MPAVGALFRLALGHAGDAADPELLHWIKEQMDAILGLPPWAVVAMMGAIVLLIPTAVISVYLWQQRRLQQLPPPDEIHPGEH